MAQMTMLELEKEFTAVREKARGLQEYL